MPKKATSAEDALAMFEEDFEKSMGKGTLKKGHTTYYDVIPTGSLLLDWATGIGGYPKGRITELYGLMDLGKSQLCLLAAAEAQGQQPNRMVGYIDVENKIDDDWAHAHGVNLNKLYKYVPKTAEDTADGMKKMLSSGLFSLVVIDSVGAMIGKAEMEKNAGDDTVAIVARIVTRMIKLANAVADEQNAVVLIVNQIRSDISRFGGGTTRPGGWALKFQSTMLLKLGRTDKPILTANVKGGTNIPVGKEIAVKVERNKCYPAGFVANIMLHNLASPYGEVGIDRADEALSVGGKLKIVQRAGAYYTLPNGQRFQGQEAAREYLRAHPKDIEAIRTACIMAKPNVTISDEDVDAGITVDVLTGEITGAPIGAPTEAHRPSREVMALPTPSPAPTAPIEPPRPLSVPVEVPVDIPLDIPIGGPVEPTADTEFGYWGTGW